jgi:CDP-glucose 4,6-dehydratase
VESVAVNPQFWAGKKVFVTGHTGFKGGWLCLWLQNMGAEMTGYALNPPTQPSFFEVAQVARGMHSVIGDIRDGAALVVAMREAAPDIVIHMAAQALVRYSYVHPVETYSTNVMGVVQLFEAVRQTKSVRAVLSVTSDKCYENREWVWGYREDEAMGGYDPYSSSKGCAELVTAAYRRSYFDPAGVALASARAGNVVGGGDWAADRLVPDILRALSGNLPVMVRNPLAIRPWQHVLEPLCGYLQLARKLFEEGGAYAEGWNFGPADQDARPVQWIVEQLIQLWGEGAIWKLDRVEQPHEAHYLKLDCSKAKARLGWQPRWALAQGLEKIVAWHKAQQRGENMREYSLQQIAAFQAQK